MAAGLAPERLPRLQARAMMQDQKRGHRLPHFGQGSGGVAGSWRVWGPKYRTTHRSRGFRDQSPVPRKYSTVYLPGSYSSFHCKLEASACSLHQVTLGSSGSCSP